MLIHYVIVRRDLPIGVLAAMTIHAAGESASLQQACKSVGPYLWQEGATAVALAVSDEAALKEVKLTLPHIKVVESNGVYKDQLMAIGVLPGPEEVLRPVMAEFDLLS